jgi:HD-like signal output (HDOD) protein/CheY-like chemotaxis protein
MGVSPGGVLICSEDPQLAVSVREPLGSQGKRLIELSDEEAVLERARSDRPVLIVLSIKDGGSSDPLATCRKLLEEVELQSIPVLLLASSNGREYLSEAIRLGVAGMLERPVPVPVLLEKLEQLLAQPSPVPGGPPSSPYQRKVRTAETQELVRRIKQVKNFQAMPAVAQRVLDTVRDENAGAGDLAKVISQDQSLAVEVLRIANSAFYGHRGKVSDLSKAVILLGFSDVANLIMGVSVFRMVKGLGLRALDPMAFWEHALATAVIAEGLAKEAGFRPPGEAFVAGLLHDTGKLVLDQLHPKEYAEAIRRSAEEGKFLRDTERAIFSETHAFAGEVLATQWGLPEGIRMVMAHHHWPMAVEREHYQHVQLIRLVYLADVLCKGMRFGSSGDGLVEDGRARIWNLVRWSRERLGKTLDRCREEIYAVKESMGFSRAAAGPEEQVEIPRAVVIDESERPVSMADLVLRSGGYACTVVHGWGDFLREVEAEPSKPVLSVLDTPMVPSESRFFDLLEKRGADLPVPLIVLAPQGGRGAVSSRTATVLWKPYRGEALLGGAARLSGAKPA